jgi:hypothetical protein
MAAWWLGGGWGGVSEGRVRLRRWLLWSGEAAAEEHAGTFDEAMEDLRDEKSGE